MIISVSDYFASYCQLLYTKSSSTQKLNHITYTLYLGDSAVRELIKLVSSAKTGHFYTTSKNKRKKPEKLEVKKYDPVVRKHVMYKESKI